MIVCDAINEPVPIKDVRKVSKFDLIRGELSNEFRDGKIIHLGKGIFSISLPAIVGIDGELIQYFSISFLHRVHRIEMKHSDASRVDSNNAFSYTLRYGTELSPDLLFSLLKNVDSLAADTAHLFDEYDRSPSRYQLSTFADTGHLLYFTMIIEIEDLPNRGD